MAYHQLLGCGIGSVAKVVEGLHHFLEDTDLSSYLMMMTIRLVEMYKLLKSTGSIYLHCDPTASHYLKIIMDSIFGKKNFRNEIIWYYKSAAMTGAKKIFPRKHDVILFYTKSDNYKFYPQRESELSSQMKTRWGKYIEKDGKSILWRSIKNESGQVKKHKLRLTNKLGREPQDEDIAWEANPSLIRSVWTDIPEIRNNPKYSSSLGFDTQKPSKLLERIIKTSTDEGDLIFDPFCGCGTTIIASEKLKREWVGVDVTHYAIRIIEDEMQQKFGIIPIINGVPTTFESAKHLADTNPFQFESWALSIVPNSIPNSKGGSDGGVDGQFFIAVEQHSKNNIKYERGIIQIKSGQRIYPKDVQALCGAMLKKNAMFGIFICIKEPTEDMKKEAANAGIYESKDGQRYPKLQIHTIRDHFANKNLNLPSLVNVFRDGVIIPKL